MTTLVLSILNGSSSFLHTIRTTIKAWMILNFGKILSLTWELAALDSVYPRNKKGQGNFIKKGTLSARWAIKKGTLSAR